MSPVLVQRQLSIAAATLLGVVVALAVGARDSRTQAARPRLPEPAVAAVDGWYTALAGVRGRALAGRRSACGTLLSPRTLGVDHPVLPCGARIYLDYGGKTVLTSVVDRGPYSPGQEFELTPALAELVGLSGVQTVRWSFARAS